MRERFIGSWRLVASDWEDARGTVVDSPLGTDPAGLLMYDASGHVSAQLSRRDQARFRDDDFRKASAIEKVAAWSGYFGYFGRYTVDETAGTVTHHVEGASFPNLVGLEQLRHFAFAGNRLTLDAVTPWGRLSLVWERLV
jgi:hypothetical protein